MAKDSAQNSVSLDINFQDFLDSSTCALLVVSLLKNLLYQRQQIPVSYESLQRDFASPPKPPTEPTITMSGDGGNRVTNRERLKNLNRSKQAKMLYDRYYTKLKNFIPDVECLFESLNKHLTHNARFVECVCLFLGFSPFVPKEVYTIILPKYNGFSVAENYRCSDKAYHNASRLLFRTLVMDSNVFDIFGKAIALTNVYISIKHTSASNVEQWSCGNNDVDWLVNRPNFDVTCIDRCKHSLMLFLNWPPSKNTFQTPSTNLGERYTPVPMELCTPFTVVKSNRSKLWQRREKMKENVENDRQTTSKRQLDFGATPCCAIRNIGDDSIEPNCSDVNEILNNLSLSPTFMDSEWVFAKTVVKGFKDPRAPLYKS